MMGRQEKGGEVQAKMDDGKNEKKTMTGEFKK